MLGASTMGVLQQHYFIIDLYTVTVCSTTLAKCSNLYHLSLKPYSYKQSCNSVCISKLASMWVNHIMKRCIAEVHALRHKTPLNTCTPLSKLTRILNGVCWKLWLQKMATQIWQNANLKKWQNRISNHNCDNAVWIWKFIQKKKKKVAGENFWLVR